MQDHQVACTVKNGTNPVYHHGNHHYHHEKKNTISQDEVIPGD
jgi:hypothetical protein